MRSNRPAFKSSAFTARTSTTSESASLTSVQLPSDNLYNKSFLLESGQRKQRPQNSTPSRTPHQRRSATDTPIHAQKTPSSYGSSQLGNQEQQTDIHRSKKKSYRKLLRYLSMLTLIMKIILKSVIDQKIMKFIDLIVQVIVLLIVSSSLSVSSYRSSTLSSYQEQKV